MYRKNLLCLLLGHDYSKKIDGWKILEGNNKFCSRCGTWVWQGWSGYGNGLIPEIKARLKVIKNYIRTAVSNMIAYIGNQKGKPF